MLQPLLGLLLFVTSALAAGCIDSVRVADNRPPFSGGTAGQGGGGSPPENQDVVDASVGECPAPGEPWDPDAQWKGYASFEEFGTSESGTLRLSLPAADGSPGWLVVGNGPRLAAPTRPDECFPSCDFPDGPAIATPLDWHDGFAYPLSGVRVGANRVRFTVNTYAVWDAWCAMQTPSPAANGKFQCLAHEAGTGFIEDGECFVELLSGTETEVPCCQYALCVGETVCRCDRGGCRAVKREVGFDLVRKDGALEGFMESGTPVYLTERKVDADFPDASLPDAGLPAANLPITGMDAGLPDASVTMTGSGG